MCEKIKAFWFYKPFPLIIVVLQIQVFQIPRKIVTQNFQISRKIVVYKGITPGLLNFSFLYSKLMLAVRCIIFSNLKRDKGQRHCSEAWR